MSSRATLFLTTLSALGGCATRYTPGPLPSDHPAHPEAMAAPASPPSLTLAVNDPLRTAATMPHDGHELHRPAAAAPPVAAPQLLPATREAATPVLYACPMHPDVVSTKPDDRCPECNMKINKRVGQPADPSTAPAAPTAPARADHAGHHNGHGGH